MSTQEWWGGAGGEGRADSGEQGVNNDDLEGLDPRILGSRDHNPSPRQMPNRLTHPGIPTGNILNALHHIMIV